MNIEVKTLKQAWGNFRRIINVIKICLLSFSITSLSSALLAEDLSGDIFGDNSRWAIDLSLRTSENLGSHQSFNQYALGFDLHKVFSNETGDIGTLIFQPYLLSLNNHPNPPFFFNDGDGTELTWRIANFNYTGLANGKLNFRIGHFEIPFGLEKDLDTNGTLRQYTFGRRGIKADWGVSINGELPSFNYELAQTRGTGNELNPDQHSQIFSGRIGTSNFQNFILGASFFDGSVLGDSGLTKHQLLAIDAAYYIYNWEFLFEHSAGDKNSASVKNTLAEISWLNSIETIQIYFQLQLEQNNQINEWLSSSSAGVGIRWRPNNRWDISAQFSDAINDNNFSTTPTILSFQISQRF